MPTEIVAALLDLSDVHSRTDLETEGLDRLDGGQGASRRARRTVERR